MPCAASRCATRTRPDMRLAPGIALVLAVKIVGLVVLWFLFVRGQRVAVDAHGTASALGLLEVHQDSRTKLEENVHGQ